MTLSRERTHQEQKKDGKLTNIVAFTMYFSFITLFGIHCCNRTAICSSFFFHNNTVVYVIVDRLIH